MKSSLRNPKNGSEVKKLSVEIRLFHNYDTLTSEEEEKLLNVIVTSSAKLIHSLTKGEIHIKNQTNFERLNPDFYSELRITLEGQF